MAFVVWKLLRDLLPADDRLMRRGISLASKCLCCEQQETVAHVFLTNPVAVQIWDFFAQMQGIIHPMLTTAHQALVTWSLSASTRGHIRHIFPVVTMWALWEARNKAKHISAGYTFEGIKHKIMQHLSSITTAHLTQRKYWAGAETLVTALGAHVKRNTIKPPRVLKWETPEQGRLKLNIDASYKGNISGYGGVLRDCCGTLICVVGMQGGSSSPLEAELDAVRVILHWCVDNGYQRLEVETDSMLLAKQLRERTTSWAAIGRLKHIQHLLDSSHSTLAHVYREKNMVADWLASTVVRERRSFVWGADSAPTKLRQLLRLEREGLPYVRGGSVLGS